MVADVLEGKEHVIEKILETGMAKKDLEKKIAQKQQEYGGLLTEAGAAYSIAKELGVELPELESEQPQFIPINQLKPGLESVDVKAKVVSVFPVREWSKGERSGKVGNAVISDDTAEARLVLWNQDAELIETGKLQRGTLVEIRDAVVRESAGMIDVNLGFKGRIAIKGAEPEKAIKLSELSQGMSYVDCFARVVRVFPERAFKTERGPGKVKNAAITDGTQVNLALWNEHADQELQVGDVIKVEGGYVKQDRFGLSLNLGTRGRLLLNPENAPSLPEPGQDKKSISDLDQGDRADIRANIVRMYPPTVFEVCEKCGRKECQCDANKTKVMVMNAELDDGTGVIRGVFFREKAKEILGFSAQDYEKNPDVFDERAFLGQERVFEGIVKKNALFDRNELVINGIRNIDIQEDIESV